MSRIEYDDLKECAIAGSDEALAVLLDWLEQQGVDRDQRQIRHVEILLLRAGRQLCQIDYDILNGVQALRAELNRWSANDQAGLPKFFEYRLGMAAIRAMLNPRVIEAAHARVYQDAAQTEPEPDPRLRLTVVYTYAVPQSEGRWGYGYIYLSFYRGGTGRWETRRSECNLAGTATHESVRPSKHEVAYKVTTYSPFSPDLPVYVHAQPLPLMPSGFAARV